MRFSSLFSSWSLLQKFTDHQAFSYCPVQQLWGLWRRLSSTRYLPFSGSTEYRTTRLQAQASDPLQWPRRKAETEPWTSRLDWFFEASVGEPYG